MTAETRWVSSTFAYLYLIFSKLTLQPLSLVTASQGKRWRGCVVEKVSVPFFFPFPQKTLTNPPKKHTACNQASKNYNSRRWVTRRRLAGRVYLTQIFSAAGPRADNPCGPPKAALRARNPVLLRKTRHQAGPARTVGGCSFFFLGGITRWPSKFKRQACNDSRGRAPGHPSEARAVISG